jgi:hypothetical protein
MIKQNSQNTNLAAEFYIASQLFRLGYIVTITLGHTKEIDLIVAHPDGRTCTIDVKGLKNTTNWPLNLKLKKKDHFFVLVSYLNKFDQIEVSPDVFVVPSLYVDNLLTKWTGRPEVTCIGYGKLKNSKFRNAWHLLFK